MPTQHVAKVSSPEHAPARAHTTTVVITGPEAAAEVDAFAGGLGPEHTLRTMPVASAIGRDLRTADRIVLWPWSVLDEVPHLGELLQRRRAALLVAIPAGQTPDALPAQALHRLRRLAASVLVFSASDAIAWQQAMLVPVHHVADGPDLAAALSAAHGSDDSATAHLLDATRWLARGEGEAALLATMRAIRLAPDQPRIVAETALLLHGLGDRAPAIRLCEAFLRQRPDAAIVRQALAAIGSGPGNDVAVR